MLFLMSAHPCAKGTGQRPAGQVLISSPGLCPCGRLLIGLETCLPELQAIKEVRESEIGRKM